MKTWFDIKAKNNRAEIAIYDEVGMFGISAKQFNEELKAAGDVQSITLRINSPGGDVFDGVAIYNMLKRHKARVEVLVDGIAASIASVIAMAGDKITMPSNTFMFIHNPLALAIGDADDMREEADALDKIASSLRSTYMAKTGKDEKEVKKWMSEDTWFSAAEALEAGLADEVIDSVQIAAFFDLHKFANAPAAIQKPTPAPDLAPVLSKAENAIVAKAAKIVEETETAKLRRAALNEATEIIQACTDAGHLELVAGFLAAGLDLERVKSELVKPTNIATAAGAGTPEELQKIYALCRKAGVADLADSFVAENRTVDWVTDRLKHAGSIHAQVAACNHFAKPYLGAPMTNRAAEFIRAGATPEEVAASLQILLVSLQGPEIDNHIGPEAYLGNPSATGEPPRPRPKLMKNAELYARMNSRSFTSAEVYAMRKHRMNDSER